MSSYGSKFSLVEELPNPWLVIETKLFCKEDEARKFLVFASKEFALSRAKLLFVYIQQRNNETSCSYQT